MCKLEYYEYRNILVHLRHALCQLQKTFDALSSFVLYTEKDFFCNEVLETGYHHAQLFEQRKKGFKVRTISELSSAAASCAILDLTLHFSSLALFCYTAFPFVTKHPIQHYYHLSSKSCKPYCSAVHDAHVVCVSMLCRWQHLATGYEPYLEYRHVTDVPFCFLVLVDCVLFLVSLLSVL